MAYIFVHFRETEGVEGEQIYFAVSKDGFYWEPVNGGNIAIEADKGDMGVRDIVITRTPDNKFVMMATDLALRKNEVTKYGGHIKGAFTKGSKALAMWKSDDLVNWSEEILVDLSDGHLGCLWAPGIFWDENSKQYLVHWASTAKEEDYAGLSIYCATTTDFEHFSKTKLFYKKEDSETLDSCIYYENGVYHFFVKSADNPKAVIHMTSKELMGPYVRDEAFDLHMDKLDNKRAYEAPTVFRASDGELYLLMDYYGCEKREDQGYVPFALGNLENPKLDMVKEKFHFPYGFKHGVTLEITDEEYERVLKWK